MEVNPSSNASTVGTWANGRRLTNAQRERKRAVNRASRRLQGQTERSDYATLSFGGWPYAARDGSEDNHAIPSPSQHQLASIAQSLPACSSSVAATNFPFAENPLESRCTPQDAIFTTVPLPHFQRDPCARDMTEMLNNGVQSALSADSSLICLDANLNESVLAHAVLYGWAAAEQNHNTLCPVHFALRYLDENLLMGVGKIERLTMLHCVSRQILVRSNAKQGGKPVRPLANDISCQSHRFSELNERQAIWPWYRARPSQNALTHDAIVDYIVWPGMRERLVFGGEQALANAFWMAFFKDYRFYWPCEDARAAFKSEGSLLVFADELRNRLDDLSHWRFNMAFFDRFPDFADDVLPTQTLPRTLQIWVVAARREDAKRKKRRKNPIFENLIPGNEAD